VDCLRCDGTELPLGSLSCPRCGREYRLTPEGRLAERWVGPIGLVLYPIAFSDEPQAEAGRIAAELYAASQPGARSIFRSLTSDELRSLLAELRLELEHPSQRVQDILGLDKDEASLREYLALVAERLGDLCS
jgi:hypothetical protein